MISRIFPYFSHLHVRDFPAFRRRIVLNSTRGIRRTCPPGTSEMRRLSSHGEFDEVQVKQLMFFPQKTTNKFVWSDLFYPFLMFQKRISLNLGSVWAKPRLESEESMFSEGNWLKREDKVNWNCCTDSCPVVSCQSLEFRYVVVTFVHS